MSRLGKVRVVRAERREGLIRARLLGVAAATGEILIFLDSHCEVAPGTVINEIYSRHVIGNGYILEIVATPFATQQPFSNITELSVQYSNLILFPANICSARCNHLQPV